MGLDLLAGSVGGLAHYPKVGWTIVTGVVVAMIDIFAVTFTDTSG
jgi:hypothetical protein